MVCDHNQFKRILQVDEVSRVPEILSGTQYVLWEDNLIYYILKEIKIFLFAVIVK